MADDDLTQRRPSTWLPWLVCTLVAVTALVTGAGRDFAVGSLGPSRVRLGSQVLIAVAAVALAILALSALRRNTARRCFGLVALGSVGYLAGATADLSSIEPVAACHRLAYVVLAIAAARAFRAPVAIPLVGAMATVTVVALIDEGSQWWLVGITRSRGLLDVGVDLALGGVGLLLVGLVLFAGELAPVNRHTWVRTLRMVALSLPLVALFIDRVHLGHLVPVPGANAYVRSRFAPAALEKLATTWQPQDRAIGLLARLRTGHDRYRTEADWHVTQRDAAIANGSLGRTLQSELALQQWYSRCLAATGRESTPAYDSAVAWREVRRVPRDLGPPQIYVAFDRLALWLLCVSLATALLLAAEGLALNRTSQ